MSLSIATPSATSSATSTTPATDDATDPVSRFVAAIASGTGIPADIFSDDAILDATVPGWRFTNRGNRNISAQFAHWFANAGWFEEIERTPLPDGELLEFTIAWTANGVRYAAHQSHRLEIDGQHIRADRTWCGGQWSASLLAEMAAAEAASC